MANMNVTYAELDTTANQLTQGQGDLEQILSNLQQIVGNLVSSGFVTDAASGAFQQSYDDFTSGAKQTVAGLEACRSSSSRPRRRCPTSTRSWRRASAADNTHRREGRPGTRAGPPLACLCTG